MAYSFWENREIDVKLPSNMTLLAEGFDPEDFVKWKEFFGAGGRYVKDDIIPVKCRCTPLHVCYKHRMEDLRKLYAKPRTGVEIVEEELVDFQGLSGREALGKLEVENNE